MTKIFWMLMVLLISGSFVPAQATEITAQMANAYFNNCTSKPAAGMSQQTQQYMCACTAEKMQKSLTAEDIQAMSQQNAAGRLATNKMIIDVYAPCIEYPARDHYYTTCMTNPQTKNMSSNPQGLCACLGTQISTYLKQNAQNEFKRILARTPNVTDPMAALTNDPAFTQFAQKKLTACVR